jgi:predicted methyltransferase
LSERFTESPVTYCGGVQHVVDARRIRGEIAVKYPVFDEVTMQIRFSDTSHVNIFNTLFGRTHRMSKNESKEIAYRIGSGVPDYIRKAIEDESRPATDRNTDPNRKPAELMAFAGIRPGDRVADLIPGRGYLTRIFSGIVGDGGKVIAIYPTLFADAKPAGVDAMRALVAEPRYGNASLQIQTIERIAVAEPVDFAWISLNYHDVFGRVGEESAAKLAASVFDALKPGGVFIVIDHAAKAGRGGRDANTLHRIEAATVIEQAVAAGFVLEDRSDALANREDNHTEPVFTAELSGHTDKFVLKFRKPETKNS